ncbi:MAG: prephenate dehydratase [Clostridium sp.]|uniref:prephenate dehydratase n=1 Tax=Clostridium sp. TaxID=1506 RepID=UPI002FCB4D06
MSDLKQYRDEIDRIDNAILKLFQERMDMVLNVAEYKRKNNLEVLNRKREEEVIENHLNNLSDSKYKVEVEKFLKSVMEISRQCQRNYLLNGGAFEEENTCPEIINLTKDSVIGFQGVNGSYSEEALHAFFKEDVKTRALNTFDDVFKSLTDGEIDYGVIPIENSSTGGVLEVYDLLNKHEFSIVGEMCIRINHCLIAEDGADFNTIKEVYSHQQALDQCRDYINSKGYRKVPYLNTAKSVEFIREANDKSLAAIASKRAANIYGLNILEENINTNKTNTTRFIIISKKMAVNEQCNKISIVFSIDHKIGCLYNVLRYFSENQVNMLKIESRPMKERPWEYIFYIDFEGNTSDPKVKIALENIKDNTNYFRLLGNYPKSLENC